ncbi:MAG: 2-C-methyl-D-erythritol 4-phosphate cytidylyltransferase [Planctomycetes bacterium]|nr:2-C-methyl-D-erythritol 4-phosphate cytidylyltransferase [Planctomycetota bacterium]
MKNVCVIICAAGAGVRFGGRKKKPFVEVSGQAVFARSVGYFANRDDVKQILVAIPAEDEELIEIKYGATLNFMGAKLCLGGSERFETVSKALELVGDDIELVAVHDAVRCCLTDKWIDDVFAEAEKSGAAMLACPIVGTVKRVENGQIVATVDRSGLFEAQTPQVFEKALLAKAYKNLDNLDKSTISDDSQLVEALGEKVSVVETDHSNVKITRKADVAIAEAIIRSRPKPKPDGPVGPYAEAVW